MLHITAEGLTREDRTLVRTPTHLHQRKPLFCRDAEVLELLVADALKIAHSQCRGPKHLTGPTQPYTQQPGIIRGACAARLSSTEASGAPTVGCPEI